MMHSLLHIDHPNSRLPYLGVETLYSRGEWRRRARIRHHWSGQRGGHHSSRTPRGRRRVGRRGEEERFRSQRGHHHRSGCGIR